MIAALEQLNRDPRVHGIIVQLPLPKNVDARHVTQAIALEKDVDGFNWSNLGALVEGGRVHAVHAGGCHCAFSTTRRFRSGATPWSSAAAASSASRSR